MINTLFETAQIAHTKRPDIIKQEIKNGTVSYNFMYMTKPSFVCKKIKQKGDMITLKVWTNTNPKDLQDIIKNLRACTN